MFFTASPISRLVLALKAAARRARVVGVGVIVGVLAAAGLAGCSPFDDHRADLRQLHAAGRYDLAEQALLDPENRKRYGKQDELLWLLDRGAVAVALGDHETAIDALGRAEELMERRRKPEFVESLGVLLINDRQGPYLGEPYEEMYLNVLKMLAHLEAGQVIGGATVEARRMAIKADLLRDEYVQLAPEVRKASTVDPDAPAPLRAVASVNEAGEFIESTLGLFLTAVTFMLSGEDQNQAVAGRRLQEAIELQRQLIGPVDPAPFEEIGELHPSDVNAMVVAFSGRGPHKEPFRLPPLIILDTPIYLELPVLRWPASSVAGVRVAVREGESEGATTVAAELHFIENLAAVANENHKRQLPLIYARTFARSAAKSVGLTFATRAARGGGRGEGNEAAGAAAVIGGLLLLLATERADLRSWTFLPGQAHVGLLNLEPGTHEVRIEYLSHAGGALHASAWRTITVGDGLFSTVVEHFPR